MSVTPRYLQDTIQITPAQKTALVRAIADKRGLARRAAGENPSDKLLLSNARREVNSKIGSSFALKTRRADNAFLEALTDIVSTGGQFYPTAIFDKYISPSNGWSQPQEFSSRQDAIDWIEEAILFDNTHAPEDERWRTHGAEPYPAGYQLTQNLPGSIKEDFAFGDRGKTRKTVRTQSTFEVMQKVYYLPSS